MFAILKKGRLGITRRPFALSTTSHFRPSFDPYTYTQGRWLDRDEERREARKLLFNFNALLDLAIKCSPGAHHVTGCKKKEGGFNRVFMIQLDNGKTVVARLPTRIAGPPRLTVSSEVATLQFVRENTDIPVPRVLAWSSETKNAIGAEYIMMDEMPGVPLKDVWNSMTASQHIRCIQSLGHLSVQLWKLDFPSYGSLYLRDKSPPGAVPLDDTFSIGPLCTSHLWSHNTPGSPNANMSADSLGPWKNLEAYLSGLLSRVVLSAPAESRQAPCSEILYSEEAHTALLDATEKSLRIVIETGPVKDASSPTLFHPDLHTRNIFVDSDDFTKITGIIDWQSSAIEPSFMLTAETPDFAQELPDDGSSHETSNAQADELSPQAKIRADAEFCAKVWAVMLHISPKSRAAHDLNQSLIHFLASGSAGWLKDAVTARQILLELGEKWDELQLPGRSFYRPTEKETEELKRQVDILKTDHRLREHLSNLLGCQTDGWVPTEKWDEILPIYRKERQLFFDSFLQERSADEDEATAYREAERLWPFDQQ